MMDVTLVKTFLGLPELHLAGVFDASSRAPLALQVFETRPGASDMARLFKRAVRSFGKPKYLITDLGGEFTGRIFAKTVGRLGALQRFASKDNLYATARLERFWRTIKENAGLYGLHLPLSAEDLEHRLETTLAHYLLFRPHQGLHGATPAEAFLGVEAACQRAASPARGRPGEGPDRPPFSIEYLDPENESFPILRAAS